jgi:hypothetical protein
VIEPTHMYAPPGGPPCRRSRLHTAWPHRHTKKTACYARVDSACRPESRGRRTRTSVHPSLGARTYAGTSCKRAVDPVPARSCGADERSMQIEQRRFVEASRARRAMNIRPGVRGCLSHGVIMHHMTSRGFTLMIHALV